MKCRLRLLEAKIPSDRNSIFSRTYVQSLNIKYQYDSQIKNIEENQVFIVNLPQDNAFGKDDPADNEYYNISYLLMNIYKTSIVSDSLSGWIGFYVDKIIRNTKSSIIIYATLDVCNFFNDGQFEDNFTDECLIDRALINRWKDYTNTSNPYMLPIIDFHNEEFNEPTKYLKSSTKIQDQMSGKWYAIYYSDPESSKTGVRTFLVPKTTASYLVSYPIITNIIVEADTYYIFRQKDNIGKTIAVGTTSWTFSSTIQNEGQEIHIYNDGGTIKMYLHEFDYDDVANNWREYTDADTYLGGSNTATTIDVTGGIYSYYTMPLHYKAYTRNYYFPTLELHKKYATTSTLSQTQSVTGLDDIPRTNTRIIKIIDLPYYPASFNDTFYSNIIDDFMNIYVLELVEGKSFSGSSITANDYKTDDYLKEKPTSYNVAHSMQYETKFKNSSFDEKNFEYGAYKFTITPEMYDINSNNRYEYFYFNYKQSLLKSSFAIEIVQNSWQLKDEFAGYPNVEANYIVSDLDNEIPVFNNEYINYMKNGYNYDKESIARQTLKSSLTAGASIIGGIGLGVAGGVAGGVIGLSTAQAGFSSLTNIITNQIQQEARMEYKMNSYKNSKTGISGVSDLELRKMYQADALYFREYKISNSLRNNLYNYWRLYGYKINEYANPVTFVNNNLRHRYNYIKLSSVEFTEDFYKRFSKFNDLIEIYKNKLLEGIYIYYRKSDGTNLICDFDKYYENFEEGIVWEGE